MMMRSRPSLGPGVFLLALAVAIVSFTSPGASSEPIVGLSCCSRLSHRRPATIERCFEQKPRKGCNFHAFLIQTGTGRLVCVNPKVKWLRDMRKKDGLSCPPDLTLTK